MMFVSLLMGSWSFLNLGREEDPSFAIKTMVIQARWPGATLPDTLQQVTDRLEKKLEEIDALDYVKSYTLAGESTLLSSSKARPVAPTSRQRGIRYARRSAMYAANCPAAFRALHSTTSLVMCSAVSMRSPLTACRSASCAITSNRCAPISAACPTWARSSCSVPSAKSFI
ncbi:efflux RND transporter permease subunit [Pseudomonas amygdali pv. morsprunorum]|nr:efflux RND transporter permease subunit [Pseudomonas amygdali pv. morsprunorum]